MYLLSNKICIDLMPWKFEKYISVENDYVDFIMN